MLKQYKIDRISYINQEQTSEIRALLDNLALEEGRSHKYFIRTFGCQQNESDSEKLAGILEGLGFEAVSSYEEADLVLLNTCSIRENADQRLFGHLGELKALRKDHKKLKVAVCGCLPTQEEQRHKIRESFSFVDLIFGPQDLHRLPEFIYDLYSGGKRLNRVSKDNVVCESIPTKRERKFRALVSIMYGCNNFCTYCVVPSTRERERSRLPEDILTEVQGLASEGIPEIMLLGQNVNAYGFDLQGGKRHRIADLNYDHETIARLKAIRAGDRSIPINSFARLVTAIAAVGGIKSVRYMSPHPRDFDGEMLAALLVSPEIENHIHLPVQAGSNQVLQAMNRHYTREDYLRIIKEIKKVRPDISISTDIMVGFPTEEEEDFQETLSLVEEVGFASAFSFIYSPRPHTPAANMEQVDQEVKHERFNRLVELLNRLSFEEHERIVGTRRKVLLEGTSKQSNQILTGRDSEFHLINIHLDSELEYPPEAYLADGSFDSDYFEGKFVEVEITEAKTYSVEAKCLKKKNS